jgi:hypothetical protein
MESALVRAAGQERRSAKARAGIVVVQDLVLEYDGPKDPNVLCEDTTFRLRCGVRIGTNRVMRTRPRFDNWTATLSLDFLPSLLNEDDVHSFLTTAGNQIGIGDWRPRFGRFSHEKVPMTRKRRNSL